MQPQRAFKRIFAFVLTGGLALVTALSGCGIINPRPTVTPTPTLTQTPTPSSTPTITLTPTRVRPSATPTIPPTPTATPVTACIWSPSVNFYPGQAADGGTAYELPQPQNLLWEPFQGENDAQLWQLSGLTTRILNAQLSPDKNWLAAELETYRPSDRMMPGRAALFVLDGSGQNHWQAGGEQDSIYHRFDWLPDGRIVWTDGGKLYLSDSAGTNRQDLDAPEPVKEVWVIKPLMLLASSDRHLFRVTLPTAGWYQIYGIPGVSRPEANLRLAPDRSFAVAVIPSNHAPDPKRFYIASSEGAVFTGEVWKVPLDPLTPGDPPDPPFWISDVNDTRRGRVSVPRPLGNSPFWQTDYYFLQDNFLPEPYVLNAANGSLDLYTKVMAEVPAAPPQVSPDSIWAFVHPYLYTTKDWKIQLTVTRDVNFLAWLADSSGILFTRDEPDGTKIVFRYILESGIEASFAQAEGKYNISASSFPGSTIWINDMQQDERGEIRRIRAFATEGEPAAEALIREPYPDEPREYPAGGQRLFFNAVTYTGGGPEPCQYRDTWLRWDY